MAKIRDFAVTINAVATTSMICEMPIHSSGDLLLAFVSKDAAAAFTAPAGWTNIQSSISAGAAGGIYGFRATTSTTTATFTLASATCMCVMVSVKQVNGTTVTDAVSASSATAADDTSIPFASGTVTPAQSNTLVFSSFYSDIGIGIGPNPTWVNVFSGDTGLNSLGVAYSFSTNTNAVTGTDWYAGTVTTGVDGRGFMIAVRDNGSLSEIDPYIPRATTPSTLLSVLSGDATSDIGTWISGNQRIFALIGTKSTVSAAGLSISSVVDTGYNPFRATAQTPGSSSTTNLAHTEFTPTTAFNLTNLKGIVFGTFRPTIPRDYIDLGTAAQGGIYFAIGNGTTTTSYAAKAWVVGGQFSQTTLPSSRQNWAIQIGQTVDTSYGTSSAGGITVNTASIARIAIGSAGVYGAASVQWSELYLLNEIILAGGTSGVALNALDIVTAVNGGSGNIPIIEVSGSALTCWAPLRFGGTDPIRINVSLTTFQYPRQSDEIDYVNWHVDPDFVGFEFYGLSGDVIKFLNCLFTSPTSYYWRFNASHSASATIDFTGTNVVNANVTLQSTVTLSDVTFNGCKQILAAGSTLTEVTIINTAATSTQGALSITGATQTAIQTELNKLTNLTLHDNITSSGALKIIKTGSAGAVTLSMTSGDFNGNTKDIYWDAPAGSNLTINTSGTANPVSWAATNSNTVSIVSTVTFTITNIINLTEIKIFKQSDLTELAGAESVGASPSGVSNLTIASDPVNIGRYTATYSYNYADFGSPTSIYVVAMSLQYQWLRESAVLQSTNGTLQISQQLDRQYSAGSTP